jgi:hypothetical protein
MSSAVTPLPKVQTPNFQIKKGSRPLLAQHTTTLLKKEGTRSRVNTDIGRGGSQYSHRSEALQFSTHV